MLCSFVSKTAQWAKNHELELAEGKIINLPRTANWTFGPVRKSQPFTGMFQRQHLKLVIQVPGHDFTIPLSKLLKGEHQHKPTTEDALLTDVLFSKFEKELKSAKHSDYAPETHAVYYTLGDTRSRPITGDQTLHTAISLLQTANDDTICFQMCLKVNEKVIYA